VQPLLLRGKLPRHTGGTGSAGSGDGTWGQFVSLGSRARVDGAAMRTLLLAAYYTMPGVGECWDSNGGDGFRIVFGREGQTTMRAV